MFFPKEWPEKSENVFFSGKMLLLPIFFCEKEGLKMLVKLALDCTGCSSWLKSQAVVVLVEK